MANIPRALSSMVIRGPFDKADLSRARFQSSPGLDKFALELGDAAHDGQHQPAD